MSVEITMIHIETTPESGSIRAYHRDFPEIRAHGSSNLEAATLLGHQLTRALDSALTEWRRNSIEAAIADVQAYVKSIAAQA